MGWKNKGPLTEFKRLFLELDIDRQQRLLSVNMIHLGFYIKLNILMKKCTESAIIRKLHKFETIFDFLDSLN